MHVYDMNRRQTHVRCEWVNYRWVMSRMDESFGYEWDMSHVKESRHTCEWIVSHPRQIAARIITRWTKHCAWVRTTLYPQHTPTTFSWIPCVVFSTTFSLRWFYFLSNHWAYYPVVHITYPFFCAYSFAHITVSHITFPHILVSSFVQSLCNNTGHLVPTAHADNFTVNSEPSLFHDILSPILLLIPAFSFNLDRNPFPSF